MPRTTRSAAAKKDANAEGLDTQSHMSQQSHMSTRSHQSQLPAAHSRHQETQPSAPVPTAAAAVSSVSKKKAAGKTKGGKGKGKTDTPASNIQKKTGTTGTKKPRVRKDYQLNGWSLAPVTRLLKRGLFPGGRLQALAAVYGAKLVERLADHFAGKVIKPKLAKLMAERERLSKATKKRAAVAEDQLPVAFTIKPTSVYKALVNSQSEELAQLLDSMEGFVAFRNSETISTGEENKQERAETLARIKAQKEQLDAVNKALDEKIAKLTKRVRL